ncbi:MAG: RNA methyltransferase [Candidatus Marinimicrobia bacterium]|nr:RNA methyltransferase [Candidatus Neomarinimicrobiota bacterium]MDD5583341.1 RNA methyltransferase [Candidatus Neomarinimicrobiota bacterium]
MHILLKEHQKRIRLLHQKKYRSLYQLFLIEGVLLLEEALKMNALVKGIFYHPYLLDKPVFQSLLKIAQSRNIPVYEVSPTVIKSLSTEKNPQGVIAVVSQTPAPETLPSGSLLVCDEIQDPGNLGTLIRLAHWFGLAGVITTPGTVETVNPKVIRAAMGSHFHLPLFMMDIPEILKKTKKSHTILLSVVRGGTPLPELKKLENPFLLVIGNEARGVNPQWPKDVVIPVTLPSLSNCESLNAAVAAAAILSVLTYQKKD